MSTIEKVKEAVAVEEQVGINNEIYCIMTM